MQEGSMHKVSHLYLGPAHHADREGRKYWEHHASDFRNAAINISPHPSRRLNIDFEVRNHGEHAAKGVNIYLHLAELSIAKASHEVASDLLRSVVKYGQPLESWVNQVIPASSPDHDAVWRVPGGFIQAKLNEGSYDYNYVVIVVVEQEDVKFLHTVRHPDFDPTKEPQAAVWSSTLPRGN